MKRERFKEGELTRKRKKGMNMGKMEVDGKYKHVKLWKNYVINRKTKTEYTCP